MFNFCLYRIIDQCFKSTCGFCWYVPIIHGNSWKDTIKSGLNNICAVCNMASKVQECFCLLPSRLLAKIKWKARLFSMPGSHFSSHVQFMDPILVLSRTLREEDTVVPYGENVFLRFKMLLNVQFLSLSNKH